MALVSEEEVRACSSQFSLPLNDENFTKAQDLWSKVHRVNVIEKGLTEVLYREEGNDIDRPVYRWDTRPYSQIFREGFKSRSQGNTEESTYYNLHAFVHRACAPIDIPSTNHAFVSTSGNNGWEPWPSRAVLPSNGQLELYRYEIFAPGGISVPLTLKNDARRYKSQKEICFVGGISPMYIRSCLIYTVTRKGNSRFDTISNYII